MRINGTGPGAGSLGGVDTNSMVDRIMEAERIPVEQVKARKGRTTAEKNEYGKLAGMLDALGGAANGLRLPAGFTKMAVESSHPDIIDGLVDGPAAPGSYELEVRGLAQADKHLDFGFPDRDKTPVGFGYMEIERADGHPMEVAVPPGSTLNDVVDKINGSGAGVRASVVNTGFPEDPFKLLVTSEKTGEAAKVNIDADTTFLDFKNIKEGRNLDVLFEDVAVTREDNKLNDLLSGVKLNAKRSEPGTRVQVNVTHDVDKTTDGIKDFVDKYNQVAKFANQQYQLDPATQRGGQLMGDSNLRTVMRNLQTQISQGLPAADGQKYRSLAEVGITTNAKTGELQVDETKLKGALASDYEGVAKLFTASESGQGVAARLSDAVKSLKDPVAGAVPSRIRALDNIIKQQDQQIERQNRRLEQREEGLRRQFSALQGKVQTLDAQGMYMQARFGGEAEAAAKPVDTGS